MDEIKTLNNPEKSSRPFSEEWTEAWKQLEERVRQRPGPHLLMAFAIGYFLQIIPFENLLVLAVKLARPVLFLRTVPVTAGFCRMYLPHPEFHLLGCRRLSWPRLRASVGSISVLTFLSFIGLHIWNLADYVFRPYGDNKLLSEEAGL